MPVCDECSDSFEIEKLDSTTAADVVRLYRAVADGEPQREILQLIFDLFGEECGLRAPVAELKIARMCASTGRVHV